MKASPASSYWRDSSSSALASRSSNAAVSASIGIPAEVFLLVVVRVRRRRRGSARGDGAGGGRTSADFRLARRSSSGSPSADSRAESRRVDASRGSSHVSARPRRSSTSRCRVVAMVRSTSARESGSHRPWSCSSISRAADRSPSWMTRRMCVSDSVGSLIVRRNQGIGAALLAASRRPSCAHPGHVPSGRPRAGRLAARRSPGRAGG